MAFLTVLAEFCPPIKHWLRNYDSRRFRFAYISFDLCFNGQNNLVYPSPLISIFGSAPYYREALKDIDDIINASPFNSELTSALVQKQYTFSFLSIKGQEAFA
jgi:hypothetical protein